MFRTFVFSEVQYPFLPPAELLPVNRVTVPNRYFDPDAGHELYHKVLDVYRAADGLGLDVMVNEHHATSTCVNSTMPLFMAILARETEHARILCLGNPIAHRGDPVRIAEEMAMVDVISRGRLELGLVRGVPPEHFQSNVSAVDMKDKMWEGIDLLVKAMTTHDGPFSWEGRWFHHREVNIWPRPYQLPHPPLWMSTLTPGSAAELSDRDFTVATLGNGIAGCRAIFDAYRERARALGRPAPPREKLAYSPFMFVGDTDEEARREVRKVLVWASEQLRTPPQINDVPGYLPPHQRAVIAKLRASGHAVHHPAIARLTTASVDELIETGEVLAGSPDGVFDQLRTFYREVGGFGNLLPLVHYSTMSYDLTVKSLERYARDVAPRFRAEVYDAPDEGLDAAPARGRRPGA